jgi:hypothetical protein
MLLIQGQNKNFGIDVPTKESEITAEYLHTVTERVKLSKHQVIVALIMKTKVYDFCMGIRNPKKDQNVNVTTKIAKFVPCDEDSKEKPAIQNMFVGDIAVIDRSTIERGIHLSVPTIISPAGLANYLEEDKDLLTAIVTGKEPELAKQHICLVQFKIVPMSYITATYDPEDKFKDCFIKPIVESTDSSDKASTKVGGM